MRKIIGHIFIVFVFIVNLYSRDTFYNKLKDANINLLSSNIESSSIEVSINSYEMLEVNGKPDYYKVNLEGGTPILKEGAPNLPKLHTSIIIPDNANMDVIISSYDFEDFHNIKIIPSKGNLSREIDPSTIPYSFGDEYKQNKFYPENLVELGSPYILRDLRGQGVIIHPIQYNPFTKVLRVYSNIKFSVESTYSLNKVKKNVLLRKENLIKQSNEFKNIYNNLFINYPNDTRFEYLVDEGNMLIICYDDFIDEMTSFVEWKNKKGISTEIIGINDIGSSVEQMQDYIDNYYNENGLTYLLLVGDIAQIPTPIINGSSADPSYGFIEGNDSFAEVIVGRFSANNPSELTTQVERTLQYEQDPSGNVEHFNKALGIASNQGPGYGGLTDADFNDLLWNDFLYNFTYEEFTGIYDPSGSVSQGVEAINEGVGIINYTGHSGPTGWGNGAPLGVNDVNDLTNSGKLPFIFTVGCNPGEFNNYGECFCEAWMRATDSEGNPVGAVGHLGSTISQSWEPPMHGQWAMNAILTESYDENITRSYGGIAVNGCMHMNEAQGSAGINETNHWTLFGDPSLLIRTDIPNELNISYDNVIMVGQSELILDVGVDGALVALSSNGNLLTYTVSIGGIAILDLTGISNNPGEIDLVVTSFNSYPFQDTVSIIATEGAYLVFENFELVNDSNFNDFIEYNDEITINILVENVGNMNTSAINVNVTSEDEYITMINGNSMIAYAIVNEIVGTEVPISFSIAESVPDGHNAQFNVSLDDGDNEWQLTFNVEIHAPVFEILNLMISDENMDGIWDPGESSIITVDLVNSGSASFNQYPGATISTDNENIEILSGENDNTFFGIGAYTTYEGTFEVLADVLTPLNTEVDFNISWGYSPTAPCDIDCVEQAEITYSTIIGHPTMLIWDPSVQHISGNRIVEYFNNNNISGYDYSDSGLTPDISNYSKVFILLGVYPDNHVIAEDNVQGFIDLLENGGNIYMEGGDTWAFDISTTLHGMFGLGGEADGSADLSTISGIENTFTEELTFSYNGGNSYVDRLLPTDGFSILVNDDPNYVTAVAYENEELEYRTIGASHDIGGLEGENFNIYMDGILEFFNYGEGSIDPECSVGDLNEDGMIDITDIIRLVNIIIFIGDSPSNYELCAGDLNGDGLINILDVLSMINIILDRSFSINRQISSPVEEVIIEINSDNLKLITDGPIQGIQLIIESNVDLLSINDIKNMDVFYEGAIDNKHHVLIFSMDGDYLSPGEYLIFESNEIFNIHKSIIANTNNDLVDVSYKNNYFPETFILHQNYPNPFNPTTQIEIELGASENIQLIIYDINGRKVKELSNGNYPVGKHTFIWDSRDDNGNQVSSGMYFYSLISPDNISTQKMLLLK